MNCHSSVGYKYASFNVHYWTALLGMKRSGMYYFIVLHDITSSSGQTVNNIQNLYLVRYMHSQVQVPLCTNKHNEASFMRKREFSTTRAVLQSNTRWYLYSKRNRPNSKTLLDHNDNSS